jgi:hypothetical protein
MNPDMIPSPASPEFVTADLTELTPTKRLNLTMNSLEDWLLEEVFEIPGGTAETYSAIAETIEYLAQAKHGHDARKVLASEWRAELVIRYGWRRDDEGWGHDEN